MAFLFLLYKNAPNSENELMTTTSANARFVPKNIIPTPEQLAIQLSQRRISLVHANAGAAKTTTLALRIAEALARGMAPAKILALVFTDEARQILQQRLLEIGVARHHLRQIRIRSFDGFATEMLASAESVTVPVYTQAEELRPYVLEAIERVSLKYAHRYEYLDIRTHHVALSQFLDCQQRLKASMSFEDDDLGLNVEDVAINAKATLTDYLTTLEYEALRNDSYEGVVFRGPYDATYDLAQLLSYEAHWHDALPTYRLVVADELHDLNEASFSILCALLDKGDVYFVGAGDKDQVIHGELGADEAFLLDRFKQRYSHARSLPLTQTYRHGPHLAFAVEHFKNKLVSSALPLHTQIDTAYYDHADLDAGGLACLKAIKGWTDAGNTLSGCTVLLRDEHQSVAVESALLTARVPYVAQGFTPYLMRREIVFIRGLMALALSALADVPSHALRREMVGALAFFAELDLSDDDLVLAQNDIAEHPEMLALFYSGQILRTAPALPAKRMSQALEYLRVKADEGLAHEVLHEVCNILDFSAVAQRLFVHEHQALVIKKSIAGFIRVAEQKQVSVRSFYAWLIELDPSVKAESPHGQAVRLECVANSKGKEYPHVILPYLHKDEFPLNTVTTLEEENLFYVAVTRTQQQLSLLVPKDEAWRSPFVARLGINQTWDRSNQALASNRLREKAQPYVQAMTGSGPSRFRVQEPARSGERVDLVVPFAEKDEAKALGAMWDPGIKRWYVPAGVDAAAFERWLSSK